MESQTSELKARACICLCYCGRRRRASFTTAIVGSFHITTSDSVQTTELSILLKIYFWWSITVNEGWPLKRDSSEIGKMFSRHNPLFWIRKLKQRRRRRHRERQKSNRFRLAKQQLCTCITLFCTFRSRHCTTTTWKCLISRFVEEVNSRQQLSFSFPGHCGQSPLEFNSK